MTTLSTDLKYAVRSLLKSPGFSAAAVLTLALGVGANTAIFSVVHAVLLKPLPFRDPGRLVALRETRPGGAGDREVSALDFFDWRSGTRSFAGMSAWIPWGYATRIGNEPEQLGAARVSPNLFSILGVRPQLQAGFKCGKNGT